MGKNLDITMLFDFYRGMLTARQAEAVDLYYNEDLSLAEISEILGVTRQGVRDLIKRAEGIMTDTEEKLGAVLRYRNEKEKLDTAKSMADKLFDTLPEGEEKKTAGKLKELLYGIEE